MLFLRITGKASGNHIADFCFTSGGQWDEMVHDNGCIFPAIGTLGVKGLKGVLPLFSGKGRAFLKVPSLGFTFCHACLASRRLSILPVFFGFIGPIFRAGCSQVAKIFFNSGSMFLPLLWMGSSGCFCPCSALVLKGLGLSGRSFNGNVAFFTVSFISVLSTFIFEERLWVRKLFFTFATDFIVHGGVNNVF